MVSARRANRTVMLHVPPCRPQGPSGRGHAERRAQATAVVMQTDLILGIIPRGACGLGPQGIEAAGAGWNCCGEGFMGSWPPVSEGCRSDTANFHLLSRDGGRACRSSRHDSLLGLPAGPPLRRSVLGAGGGAESPVPLPRDGRWCEPVAVGVRRFTDGPAARWAAMAVRSVIASLERFCGAAIYANGCFGVGAARGEGSALWSDRDPPVGARAAASR